MAMARKLNTPNKWTDAALAVSANRFKTVKEWRTEEPSAYATACARKLLPKLTKHMFKIIVHGYWTKERVIASAKKFETIVAWVTNESSAYGAARKNGWLKEATKHMRRVGNKKIRCVYSIKVKGKKIIYIGLTGDIKRRMRDHFRDNPKIIDLVNKFGIKSLIKKQLTDYILAERAIDIERKLVTEYKSQDYKVLNIAKAGSLGGTTIKWTKEKILIEAKKYKTIAEWLKNDVLSYKAAWSMGILKEATKHMKILWEKKWTIENIIEAALKYKTFKEWIKKDKKSYAAATVRGLLDDPRITKFLIKIIGKTSKWNKKKVLKDAKKYKSRSEWKKKSPSAYRFAKKHGFFEQAVMHMKKPLKGKWTEENIIKNAKKYKTIKEWMKNEPGAYAAAQKKKLLSKATKHMKRLWKIKWNENSINTKAKKFKYRSEFKEAFPSAYAAARRLGILKKVTKHMKKKYK